MCGTRAFRVRFVGPAAVLLALVGTGCAPEAEDATLRHEAPDETLEAPAPEPELMPAPPPPAVAEAEPAARTQPAASRELTPPRREAEPRLRPRAAALPSEAAPAAGALVHGRAEIEIDEKTYAPADYLLVRLQAGTATREAWTSQTGEFYFEEVPPGEHLLHFLTSPKGIRPVHSTTIAVGRDKEVRLPPIHIPVRAIKSGAKP